MPSLVIELIEKRGGVCLGWAEEEEKEWGENEKDWGVGVEEVGGGGVDTLSLIGGS